MKKVRCIDNEGCKKELTVGKIYEVVDEGLDYYRVFENDDTCGTSYYARRFEEIKKSKYELW